MKSPLVVIFLFLYEALGVALPRSRALAAQRSSPLRPSVNTSLGLLQGYSLETEAGNQGQVFLGIPYAEPPVGDLRFTPSRPFTAKWEGARDATSYQDDCWMIKVGHEGSYPMSEDCLYLNVITSKACIASGNCPVMFYIFGGAFAFGSPREYRPDIMIDHFVSQGIVFVIPNYRMGTLGTWHTDSHHTTGNYMNYDQLNALRWVASEIAAFGGDGGRVTVMGDSSGAVDSSFLGLSPLAEGLFAQEALLSGTAVSADFTLPSDVDTVAKSFGCDSSSAQRRLDCMRALPAKNFVDVAANPSAGTITTPKLSDEFFGAELKELVARRKPRSILVGLTGVEFSGYVKPAFDALKYSPAEVELLVPGMCLFMAPLMGIEPSREFATACTLFYAKQNEDPAIQVGQIMSDVIFNVPAVEDAVQMDSIGGKAYLYSFDYVASGEDPSIYPGHAEDLNYLMWHHRPLDDDDKDVEAAYTAMFTRFIRTGSIPAPPASRFSFKYYSIDRNRTVKDHYHEEAYRFWTQIGPGIKGTKNTATPANVESARLLVAKVDEISSNPMNFLKASSQSSTSAGGQGPSLSPVNVVAAGFFTVVSLVLVATLVLSLLFKSRYSRYERIPHST